MSPDQDLPDSNDENIAKVIREAEQAVDEVRSAKERGEEDGDLFLVEDVSVLEAKLVEAEAEASAIKDKLLRSLADFDNYKKRVKRDIEDEVHRAVQRLLGDFLPVGDNLERALSVAPSAPDDKLAPLLKGLEMVRQDFFNALGKHGIKPVESVGAPFDPNLHDALQQMHSTEYAPGVVMIEYEKGYMRGEKLLRPARVIVAAPGSTGQKGAPTGGEQS